MGGKGARDPDPTLDQEGGCNYFSRYQSDLLWCVARIISHRKRTSSPLTVMLNVLCETIWRKI